MSNEDAGEEVSNLGEPAATVILQTDGQRYELILAGGGGTIRKHEVFGPFKTDNRRARKTCRNIWHLAYQWLQDEFLND